MENVEEFLKANGIQYVLHEHPAVYTCEEVEKYCDIPGLACKNLLLRDQKGKRHFLVVLPASKRTDLKKLGEIVGDRKMSFASTITLQEKLGVEPGAVSPFGLLNDKLKAVEVYIDSDVYEADIVSFHPNRNTSTLELTRDLFHKYLHIIGHKIKVVDL